MHKTALEEATLTQDSNEPQPETADTPTTPQPETPEPEITALVPTEPEVIEGEVIVIDQSEETTHHTPPKQKPYWLLIPFTILCCLVFLGVSLLLPLLTPTATVILIPVEKTVSITTAIQVQGRQLPALTLMQSGSIAATGTRHQNATRAGGTITFYNGSFSSQTIAAGTILTGQDGVQIITDQAAMIPAGNPPIYGHVSVSAHAVLAGSRGNIPAYDINQVCCATSVLAKNTEAFTGGAAAKDFLVITREDIRTAASPLQATLLQSERAALQAQLYQNEQLLTPPCLPHVSSDHKPGDEAKYVSVTVSVTCAGIAYDAHEVDANATQMITRNVITTLGTTYALLGAIQVTVVPGKVLSPRQGLVSVGVQITGTWVYQITPDRQQQLLHLVAGKPKQQALATLLQFPGIAGAQINVKGGNQQLPQEPRAITIRIQYSAV